jgi:uncharacterized lipoprotein YddW (UPF0748 family)
LCITFTEKQGVADMKGILSHRAITRSLPVAGVLAVLAGCDAGVKRQEHIRAIWVTRMDYRTEDDVVRIMENCRSLGVNTVIFQVRGNATAFYPSDREPWAEQFDFQDPGYDPLEVAVREAHKRDLFLEAWVNVMPAWRGTEPPSEPSQLYHTHPEWFWYDQHGKRQALSTFYVSLNACLPEVRAYLVDVFREIAAGYNIDALHLDYIRFPAEPPATPRGSDIDYPRDARTLKLYRDETGLAPEDNPARWTQWRADQVTKLVTNIQRMLQWTRPRAELTASVGSDPSRARERYFQHSLRWAEEGLVDVLYPMNYTDNLSTFTERMAFWTGVSEKVAVAQGIGAFRTGSPDALLAQVRTAEEENGNFCLFAYSSFFDNETHTPKPRQEGFVNALRNHLGVEE